MNKFFTILFFLLVSVMAKAQELKARVTVNSSRVSSSVNKSVFLNLQNALNNFLNNRKWTSDKYEGNEKVECNFMLNIESTDELNVYNGSLVIQSARPIFNSSYLSPLLNFKDDNIHFKYVDFQQLDFNENRVAGSDAGASNLTAVFAYYAYVILGFDAASFAMNGGDYCFQKAQNIVNSAPDGKDISGWKAFDGIRNRYWLIENMQNSRYAVMHNVYYNYYRKGMDQLYEDEKKATTELLKVVDQMDAFNTENPNTMINQVFFQGKSTELIKIFSKAAPQDKIHVREILSRIDITNAAKYKDELK